jgi:hypothetical protein
MAPGRGVSHTRHGVAARAGALRSSGIGSCSSDTRSSAKAVGPLHPREPPHPPLSRRRSRWPPAAPRASAGPNHRRARAAQPGRHERTPGPEQPTTPPPSRTASMLAARRTSSACPGRPAGADRSSLSALVSAACGSKGPPRASPSRHDADDSGTLEERDVAAEVGAVDGIPVATEQVEVPRRRVTVVVVLAHADDADRR